MRVVVGREENEMSVTILEALQNASLNLANGIKMGPSFLNIAKQQLITSIHLLEKGYSIDDEVEPLLEQYGSVENVPDREDE